MSAPNTSTSIYIPLLKNYRKILSKSIIYLHTLLIVLKNIIDKDWKRILVNRKSITLQLPIICKCNCNIQCTAQARMQS